jgi:hypothetical protein
MQRAVRGHPSDSQPGVHGGADENGGGGQGGLDGNGPVDESRCRCAITAVLLAG